MTTEPLSPGTVQLALAVNPGQTAHQLAARLGLRVTYGSRRMVYDYPVRSAADVVRALRASSLSNTEAARQFGMTRTTVRDIRSRRSWKHVA